MKTVEEDALVRVSVTGPLVHLCPHVDEVDEGSVTLSWTCADRTVELHSLAEYLRGFSGWAISHEALTDQIQEDVSALEGIENVVVSTAWTTAGFVVEVTRA